MKKTTETPKKRTTKTTTKKPAAAPKTSTAKTTKKVTQGVVDKSANILVLVESPNKCATIQKILKDGGYKNAKVIASVGHFAVIKDGGGYKNTGIYPLKEKLN